MINYYNAFISYRHAPLDSKVAEHVQRSLERFHIPHSIRKKTGVKKIERIFRDKDELPITSDLTETISNALEKADYLIVICSPNTKESAWVQREIEYFLKNHTKKQILTVLADGEPQDVIPEILTYEEHDVSEFWKEAQKVKIPIEPLSCDYRMPLRKAKKEEIPRLASALIGCSYDELVRRQRAYRVKQGIAIGAAIVAASLGLTFYTLQSKKKVDDALNESLANRARYLANQSISMLDENRRIDALYLAMSAVPQGEDDATPLVPEAVSALAQATLAYRSLNGNSIDTVWNYSLGSTIKCIEISPEGTHLAALDTSGSLTVWNTETHDMLFNIHSVTSDNAVSIKFIDDSKLVVRDYAKLLCYDADTGEVEWVFEPDNGDFIVDDPVLCSDGSLVFVDHDGAIFCLDAGSGSVRSQYQIPNDDLDVMVTPNAFAVSPDETRVAILIEVGVDEYYVVIYDMTTGRTSQSQSVEGLEKAMTWSDDDHLVVAAMEMNSDNVNNAMFNGSFIMGHDVNYVTCFAGDSANIVWTQEQVATNVGFSSGFIVLPATEMIAYYSANVCCAYDIDDGTVCYEWNTNDSIIDVSDRDGNGWPIMITKEGGLVSVCPTMAIDVIDVTYEFTDNLADAVVNHGVYTYQNSGSQIFYYNVHVSDEEWEYIGDLDSSAPKSYMSDEALILLEPCSAGTDVTVVDPVEGEVRFSVNLGSAYFSDYNVIGVFDGKAYITYGEVMEGLELLELNLTTGRISSDHISDSYYISEFAASMTNEFVTCIDRSDVTDRAVIYNVISHRTDEYDIENGLDLTYAPQYFEDIGIIYIASEGEDAIVFTETDDYMQVELPESWYNTEIVEFDAESRRIMISDRRSILFLDELGEEDFVISCGGRTITGYTLLHGEQYGEGGLLLVSCSDGSLLRYDALSGEFLGNTEISYYTNYIPTAEFVLDEQAGIMYIQQYMITSIVDLESWIELTYIENSFGHNAQSDRFFTLSYTEGDEPQLGYFRHYTVEELLAKANEILGGMPVPEDLRAMYGL